MSAPARVTHVEADAIVIADLDKYTWKRLVAAGLDVKRSWLFGDGRLAFERAAEDGKPSSDEEEKLMALARLGIAMAYDYKQGMDPAGQMLELCERGRYVGTFKQISFGDKGVEIVTLPTGLEAWQRKHSR